MLWWQGCLSAAFAVLKALHQRHPLRLHPTLQTRRATWSNRAGIPRDPRSRPREPSYAGEGWLRSGDPAPHGFRMLDAGALIL